LNNISGNAEALKEKQRNTHCHTHEALYWRHMMVKSVLPHQR